MIFVPRHQIAIMEIMELSDFIMVREAGNHILPYSGYAELNIKVDVELYCVSNLIMNNEHSVQVPLIKETDLLPLQ